MLSFLRRLAFWRRAPAPLPTTLTPQIVDLDYLAHLHLPVNEFPCLEATPRTPAVGMVHPFSPITTSIVYTTPTTMYLDGGTTFYGFTTTGTLTAHTIISNDTGACGPTPLSSPGR